MATYLLKRLLLIIPTLFGIMLISFAIIQFAPGGPVERVIAQLTGTDVSATPASAAAAATGCRQRQPVADRPGRGRRGTSKYRGAQGLDPEFIKSSRSSSASTSRRTSASS